MTLPTFFIIGAAKAGTTSLHSYLSEHPEIQMSAVKETNFFAGPANGFPYPVGRVERLSDYERLFDPTFRVRGEASPSYTNAPRRQGVPERIKAMVPGAKLVYLVRDPISRLVSQYRMRVAHGRERRSLEQAISDLDRIDASAWLFAAQSFYARQLELYLERFALDDILVIDQADLKSDRAATLREVFGFLAVDPGFESQAFEREHLRGGELPAYPPFFQRRVKPALAGPFRRLPRGLREGLRGPVERRLLGRVAEPSLDESTRARLQALFEDDVARLRSLTGKPFPSWSV